MIEAVIFDMDGVIIDSEPLWVIAQKEVFGSLGVFYDESLAIHTMGLGSFETIDFWYKRQPWKGLSFQEVESRILQRLMNLIEEQGQMIEGLLEMIRFFRSKNLKLAVASGSPLNLINHVIRMLQIANLFEIIHSAESESLGKPHPAVFLTTAQKLGISPRNCLVVEDSLNGLIAAKAGRMKAIALLRNGEYARTRYDFADLKLASLADFNETQYNYLQNLV